jgi:hypothetical protein
VILTLSTSQVIDAEDVEVYLKATYTFPPTKEETSIAPEFVQVYEFEASNVADKFVQVALLGSHPA